MLIGIRVLIGICNTFASAVQKTAAAAFGGPHLLARPEAAADFRKIFLSGAWYMSCLYLRKQEQIFRRIQ